MSVNKYQKLRPYNLIMGVIHLVQGIIMVTLSNDTVTSVKIWLPEVNFSNLEDATRDGILPVAQDFVEINFGVLISSFLFISAAAHFVTVLPGVYNWYIRNLKREINLIRWYEYALSSSVMVVVIGYLCNIRDATIFGLLFMLNLTMNLFGASMELHNADLKEKTAEYKEAYNLVAKSKRKDLPEVTPYRPNWHHFVYGCIAGSVPWIVFTIYFTTSISQIGDVVEIPDFVYAVLYVLFVFFNLFAINMVLQYKRVGKWKSYLFGEYVYVFLSLAAKSALAWIIWGGTLRG